LDPNPAVIAKAISIFYQNNPVKQAPESIPAMTMTGTAPAFYRIPVTPPLLQALKDGYYPDEETVVLRFVPRVPIQERYLDGMLSLENRRIIFQSLEAFKAVITGVRPLFSLLVAISQKFLTYQCRNKVCAEHSIRIPNE